MFPPFRPVREPPPAPPSYRLAAVDALRRGDRELYRLLTSQPGVGANPLIPTVEEVTASMDVYSDSHPESFFPHQETCLGMCAKQGDAAGVETVLGGMSPAEKATELIQSVDDPEVVAVLVEDGTDVNYRRNAEDLSDRRPDPTALHAAIRFGDALSVRLLCEAGAAVQAQPTATSVDGTPGQRSPLLSAVVRNIFAKNSCFGAMAVLLSTGKADPFEAASQKHGRTLIDLAARGSPSSTVLMDSRPYVEW